MRKKKPVKVGFVHDADITWWYPSPAVARAVFNRLLQNEGQPSEWGGVDAVEQLNQFEETVHKLGSDRNMAIFHLIEVLMCIPKKEIERVPEFNTALQWLKDHVSQEEFVQIEDLLR